MTLPNVCSNAVFLEMLEDKVQMLEMRFFVWMSNHAVISVRVYDIETSKDEVYESLNLLYTIC